jgi:excisionase family DNA binding protein
MDTLHPGALVGIPNEANLDVLLNAFTDLIAAKVSQRLGEPGWDGRKIQKRLLTVEEAAVYLGRSKEAVQHMISAGKLPIVKPDRRVFLDIRDLDNWIEGNKLQ